MLAIHNSKSGFNPIWREYCRKEGIPHKVVDCYANNVMEQLDDCDGLLWHHSHSDPRDVLIARQILSSIQHAGIRVFPDFKTAWHFDDKVGQKYLFEALDIPRLPTYVFVERSVALDWAAQTEYPKVFKLRRGAGSAQVRLVENEHQARRLIGRAFGRGFPIYDPWGSVKERFAKFGLGIYGKEEVIKGIGRLFISPRFSRVLGRERGYAYFQDFAPNNDSDTRIIVIGDRAFGIRRWVRPGDFRASGSGRVSYNPDHIAPQCVQVAFESARKLRGLCMAFDFVRTPDGRYVIVELSYGFIQQVYDACVGFWDANLEWHNESFCPQAWMVNLMLKNQ